MQLASLSNDEAVEAQTAQVKPNYVAASQSLTKKSAQGANALRKNAKLASATYSAKAVSANALKVQKSQVQKKSSFRAPKAAKKAASK
jgi:hypothetical protein